MTAAGTTCLCRQSTHSCSREHVRLYLTLLSLLPLLLQGPEDYMAVLLARADCLRHQLQASTGTSSGTGAEALGKLRAWFERGTQLMAASFPDVVDLTLRLPGYWAHVEGVVCQDLDAMRAVWENTTKGPLGK